MDWISQVIHQHGLMVGSLAVFLSGLALNLTPCVYPMIPVTLAFFSRQADGTLRRTVSLALCYVVGISLSYAVLGFVAAKTGVLFGSWLQQPAVLIVVALVMVALALSLFGVYDLQLPRALAQRLGQASSGYAGAFIMGMLVGLVAAPCVGPFLLGLLLVVSHLANPALGFLLFFLLGLGMGLPYILLAVAAGRITRLPKAGAWLLWSKRVLGVVMLGLALYFVQPLLPDVTVKLAVALLLGSSGILFNVWELRTKSRSVLRWIQRGVAALLVLSAAFIAWPRAPQAPMVKWIPYTETAFSTAQHAGRPILVDIYADWCLPCVEMDHVTFRNPDVAQALAGVAALRLDVTSEVSPDGEKLLERYRIYGAPTLLLFDRSGREHPELRQTGLVKPEELLQLLTRLR